MIYSNRGPIWVDLVLKSALLYKCEILEDLYQRLVPEKGDGWETRPLASICDHMEQCGIPPFQVYSEPDLTPIRELCLFSLPLTPLSSTPLKSFLSLQMEGFWPSSTGPKVHPGSIGCWMPRNHSWTIPGRIMHIKRLFPSCLARDDIRCDVDENMWPNAEDRVIRLQFSFLVLLFVFLCGSVIEHCVSSAKGCGFDSQGTHTDKKMYSLNVL